MLGDSEEQWAERAKRLFKAELKRADVTYDDLAGRLSKGGKRRRPSPTRSAAVRSLLPFFLRA
jgi:hypothetical protein